MAFRLFPSGRGLAVGLALAALAVSLAARADSVAVDVDGLGGEIEDNVLKFLSINNLVGDELTERQIQRAHRRALGEIRSALQPFGYYQPVVKTDLQKQPAEGEEPAQWRAEYEIRPGPETRITSLVVEASGEGRQVEAVQQAIAESELKRGERIVHSRYDATKTALLDAAYASGYLDAEFTASQLRIISGQNRAEVELRLETGPRFHFGPISFEQSVLNDDFLRRYLNFEQGEVFDTDKLTDLQLALTDADYFSQIEIEADRDKALLPPDGAAANEADRLPQLPVVVRATPRAPQKYSFSAGYGTDTGPRIGAGMELRRINRRGHKFRADARLSVVRQALSARYIIPIDDVARDSLSFGAAIKSEEFGDADTTNYGINVIREDGWRYGRRQFYLNLERENYTFGDGLTEEAEPRSADLLYPGITISSQIADNNLRTRKGFSVTADLRGGSEAALSSTDFLRFTLRGASVLPLGRKGRLLTRGEFGTIETDNFDALPPSQRFFTGGDRSVRGYDYQDISPEDADGNDIGGQYLFVGSIEAEYLVYRDFGAAVFFDAGDATNDTSADLKRGAGIGFRWLSPVGTVRLDVAHPFDDPDSDYRIHFSLGPDL